MAQYGFEELSGRIEGEIREAANDISLGLIQIRSEDTARRKEGREALSNGIAQALRLLLVAITARHVN